MLYLFVAVNDLILLPFGMLWIKKTILFLLLFDLFIKPKFKHNEYLTYLFTAGLLFIVSFFVATLYGNKLSYSTSENLGLLITLIVPMIVLNWINVSPRRIVKLLKIFLWAILFASIHKILFVFYMQGYLSFSFFDFLYGDLLGRGLVGDVDRLNTGNQLLVSLALFVAYRFFMMGRQKIFMGLVMVFCIVNIYLAASRFFTPVTFGLLGIFVFVGVKGKWVQKIIFAVLLCFFGYLLIGDLLLGRETSDIASAGNLYRIYQANFLFESFLSAPFFGNGPGFVIHNADYDLPWAFENQVLVVFAKYGLFGFVSFSFLVALQYKIFRFPLSLFHYLTIVFFIVLASIFNPYLFNTYAAWAFSIALMLAHLYNESDRIAVSSSPLLRQNTGSIETHRLIKNRHGLQPYIEGTKIL